MQKTMDEREIKKFAFHESCFKTFAQYVCPLSIVVLKDMTCFDGKVRRNIIFKIYFFTIFMLILNKIFLIVIKLRFLTIIRHLCNFLLSTSSFAY